MNLYVEYIETLAKSTYDFNRGAAVTRANPADPPIQASSLAHLPKLRTVKMKRVRVHSVGLWFVFVLILASGQVAHANCCMDSTGYYGPGMGADSLANTLVGGQYNIAVSYRLQAPHTGQLNSILVYFLPDRAGYSGGTGGRIRVTVNADDGTLAHNPSSTVLASYLITNPLTLSPSKYFPLLKFSSPPTLYAGQIYHIVFTNVDAQPAINYLSVDALYQLNTGASTQPTMSDADCAVLMKVAGKSWAERKGFTPIIAVNYSDGWTGGIGYMEAWSNAPQTVSGSSAVRENLTIAGSSETVASVSVRVAHLWGSQPLKVRLEAANGVLIEEGDIPAASIPLSAGTNSYGTSLLYSWATYKFSSAHTLASGQAYHLDLEASSSSGYQVFPIRKGFAYGFPNTSYFADGHAEFKQNASWVGWTEWGVSNRTDGDLQFYFTLAGASSPTVSSVSPTVSDVSTVTPINTKISWTTDQTSTSQVEYGTTTSYSSITPVDSALVTSHSVTLTGLVPDTVYHYRVLSINSSGEQATSGDLTFTTP